MVLSRLQAFPKTKNLDNTIQHGTVFKSQKVSFSCLVSFDAAIVLGKDSLESP